MKHPIIKNLGNLQVIEGYLIITFTDRKHNNRIFHKDKPVEEDFVMDDTAVKISVKNDKVKYKEVIE